MTDDPKSPTYETNFMGILLVVVNSFGFFALLLGLLALHPAVRRRLNGLANTKDGTKVVPVVVPGTVPGAVPGAVPVVEESKETKEDEGLKHWE